MKNKIGLLLGSLFFLFAVVSCKSTKPTVTESETTTKTKVELVHDTIFKTETDSSTYKALLECRDGKIVVKEVIKAEPGRKLKSPTVRIDNNKLSVDCEARAEELFAFWKSTQVQETVFKIKEVPIITNILTFWQQFQIKGFRVLLITTLLTIIWLIIKQKLKS
jgi:hypothetical protein